MFRARKESEMVLNSGPRRCTRELPPAGAISRDQADGRRRSRSTAALCVLLMGLMLATIAAQPARAAAVVRVSEGGLHFGDQKIGTTSEPLVLVVTNHGPGALSISGFSI